LDFEWTFVVNGAKVPGVILDNGETVHPMTTEACDALRSRGVDRRGNCNPYDRFLLRRDKSPKSLAHNARIRHQIEQYVGLKDGNAPFYSAEQPKPRRRFFF